MKSRSVCMKSKTLSTTWTWRPVTSRRWRTRSKIWSKNKTSFRVRSINSRAIKTKSKPKTDNLTERSMSLTFSWGAISWLRDMAAQSKTQECKSWETTSLESKCKSARLRGIIKNCWKTLPRGKGTPRRSLQHKTKKTRTRGTLEPDQEVPEPLPATSNFWSLKVKSVTSRRCFRTSKLQLRHSNKKVRGQETRTLTALRSFPLAWTLCWKPTKAKRRWESTSLSKRPLSKERKKRSTQPRSNTKPTSKNI